MVTADKWLCRKTPTTLQELRTGWDEWINEPVRITKNVLRIKKKKKTKLSPDVVSPWALNTAGQDLFALCKGRRGNIRQSSVRKAKQRRTHRKMRDSSVWQNQPGGIGWTMLLHFLPYCLSHSLRPQVTFVFGEMCCSTASMYVVLRLKL